MSLKRARTSSFNEYNQVSQSQGTNYTPSLRRFSYKLPKRYDNKKTIKKTINSAISRRLESKVYVDFGVNQSIVLASVTTNPTVQYLLPLLNQGLGQGGRIGNSIRIRSAKTKVFVNIANSQSGLTVGAPFMVRCMLVSSKKLNTTGVTLLPWDDFYQNGNDNSNFQGTMYDILMPINSDLWTVHADKVLKVGEGNANSTVNHNDDSSFNGSFTFDWADKFKSPIEYDDVVNIPTNRNLFMVFQAVRADGTTSIASCEYHFSNTVKYEDA